MLQNLLSERFKLAFHHEKAETGWSYRLVTQQSSDASRSGSTKASPNRPLTLDDDGMCDGPKLDVGEQYLMYTRRDSAGDMPARFVLCGRLAPPFVPGLPSVTSITAHP